jgi:hypothetical protein
VATAYVELAMFMALLNFWAWCVVVVAIIAAAVGVMYVLGLVVAAPFILLGNLIDHLLGRTNASQRRVGKLLDTRPMFDVGHRVLLVKNKKGPWNDQIGTILEVQDDQMYLVEIAEENRRDGEDGIVKVHEDSLLFLDEE